MGILKSIRAVAAGLVALASAAASAGTVTYYHNDLAGSPVVATNEAGQVIWRESYRPYGERTVKSAAATGNKVWFTSRPQDADTGLVYMGARYYDPMTGRFVSTDPVGFDEQNLHSFNRYAYANNNPYRYVDPNGEAAEDLFPQGAPIVAAGRAIGAVAAYLHGAATGNAALSAAAAQGMAEERSSNIDALIVLGTIGRATRGPEAGGGAKAENLSASEAARIQNAADRTGIEVTVVGSRESGTSRPNSDWDYVLSGGDKSKQHSIKSSLPDGHRGLGERRNQDFHSGPVDTSRPYIRFTPRSRDE